jgi:hypothetical protein
MDADRIIEALETLSLPELRRMQAKANNLISRIEDWQQPKQEHSAGSKTLYRVESSSEAFERYAAPQ